MTNTSDNMKTTTAPTSTSAHEEPESSSDVEIEGEEPSKLYQLPDRNKITLHERVDAKALRYIVDNAEGLDLAGIVHDQGQDTPLEGQLTILKKYLRKIKNGKVKVTYKQAKNNRYQANGSQSLQNISRRIRHTIAAKFYHDVDIKNAHPVLLAHYCEEYGLAHTNLSNYVDNRDEFFALLAQTGMDREAAKKLMISIINGKKLGAGDQLPERVTNFYTELSTTRKSIMNMPSNKKLVQRVRRVNKKKGKPESEDPKTVINYIMCNLENTVLIEMCNYFHSVKLDAEVLCFDGLMIPKRAVTEDALNETHLKACVSFVFEHTGMRVALAVKPMDEGLELPDLTVDGNKSYSGMKVAWEEFNFKAKKPVEFYNTEDGRIYSTSKSRLVEAYEHLTFVNDEGRDESFVKAWLKDPDMRVYKYVKCLPPPLVSPEHTYNLWDGFAVERLEEKISTDDKADAQFVLDHLKRLCNNDEAVYDYVTNWVAHLFQSPGQKNNIAVLFKSKEGMGKDAFYKLLKNMIGADYCGNTINADRDLLGNFNSFQQNKVLIVINEMSGKVGFKHSDSLKFAITSETADIRKMCTDVQANQAAFARYVFFTNNQFPIKIDGNDRRYMVVETRQPIPDAVYFTRLFKVIERPEVQLHLFEQWTQRDISQVDWLNDRPDTEFSQDLKVNSRPLELSFLLAELEKWHAEKRLKVSVAGKDLFADFRAYVLDQGLELRTTAQKFGMYLKNLHMGGYSPSKSNKGVVRDFDVEKCIEWCVDEKHLSQDALVHEEHPRLLPQAEPRRGRGVEYDPDLTGLPPL
jgi:hypothetical protein